MMDTLTPLTDEQRKLVEDNWPMNMFFLNRLKVKYHRIYDEETIYDWVTEAAIRTAQAFDPAKGSWTALYNWKLRSVISHYVHNDVRRVKGESLDEEAVDDGVQKRLKHEIRGRPCQELDDAISRISIEQTMNSLRVTPGQQKYLMELVFTDKPNQTEVAQRFGVERQAVTDAMSRVKKRFRKAVDKRGGATDWI